MKKSSGAALASSSRWPLLPPGGAGRVRACGRKANSSISATAARMADLIGAAPSSCARSSSSARISGAASKVVPWLQHQRAPTWSVSRSWRARVSRRRRRAAPHALLAARQKRPPCSKSPPQRSRRPSERPLERPETRATAAAQRSVRAARPPRPASSRLRAPPRERPEQPAPRARRRRRRQTHELDLLEGWRRGAASSGRRVREARLLVIGRVEALRGARLEGVLASGGEAEPPL